MPRELQYSHHRSQLHRRLAPHGGVLTPRFHLAKLRTEHRLVPTLTDEQLKRLIQFRPKSLQQWRPYVLALTLVDSGLRIEEALTLRPPTST